MLGEDWYLWGDWGVEDASDPTVSEPEGLGSSLTGVAFTKTEYR